MSAVLLIVVVSHPVATRIARMANCGPWQVALWAAIGGAVSVAIVLAILWIMGVLERMR